VNRLTTKQKWVAALIPMWAGVALVGLVLAFTPTKLDFGSGLGHSCGRRIGVVLDEDYGGMFDTACQSQAQGELMWVPLLALMCPVVLGAGYMLVKWAEANSARDQHARGPAPPSVPPSHLRWDGHRWLRWDGLAWVPDSDEGSF
jgi:H+/Cl- antiporter ClcA